MACEKLSERMTAYEEEVLELQNNYSKITNIFGLQFADLPRFKNILRRFYTRHNVLAFQCLSVGSVHSFNYDKKFAQGS